VIRDRHAYALLTEAERRRELARMTMDESIRLGEALLTSELMDIAVFTDDDHPLSLAKALGIRPKHRDTAKPK
jgi:hypothetical protein